MSTQPGVGDLLGVIDRLEELLQASELSEIEVEAGGTTLVLRKPQAIATAPATDASHAGAAGPGAAGPAGAAAGAAAGSGEAQGAQGPASDAPDHPPSRYHAVIAPLTGVFYTSPSPGAALYVREGGPVSAGQVIGLIEAMKLFNEIKSDITGTVRRMAAESGALVKAKQTLIEVEPS